MLPQKIIIEINDIKNLFNNFTYMKKNDSELNKLKIKIINIIENLQFYSNDIITNLILIYKQNLQIKENILSIKMVQDSEQFYQDWSHLKNLFQEFLNKIKKRIDTLQVGPINFSILEKNKFYEEIGIYIMNNNIDLLENLLNENIIDLNYIPTFAQNNDDDSDNEYQTFAIPLIIIACRNGNLNIVKMLHNNNANINININNQVENDTTPLLTAIINSDEDDNELIKYLLDSGASPNFTNLLGETPLNEAINDYQLYSEMINKYDANVNFHNVLHFACQKLNILAIKILLNKGANVNSVNGDGETPLHYFIREFNEQDANKIKEIINLFIDKNFNINIQNNGGNTILHEVIKIPVSVNIVKHLLDKGANVNITNNDGNTALHCLINQLNIYILMQLAVSEYTNAIHNDDRSLNQEIKNINEIINLFINKNFNFDLQNMFGDTVLHQAMKDPINVNIVQHLLRSDININIKNHDNKTGFQLAEASKNLEILNIISQYHNNNLSNINEASTSKRGQKRKYEFNKEK